MTASTPDPGDRSKANPSRPILSAVLVMVFLLAMVMGTGPGIRLVNPDPTDPDALRTLFGVPILYLWGVLWYLVQAGVILIAYFLLWTRESSEPE